MKRTLNPLISNKNLNLFPDCLDNRYSYANNPITRRICLSSKQSHRLRTFRVNVCEIFIQRNQKRNLKIEIRFLPFALLNFLDQEKKEKFVLHPRSKPQSTQENGREKSIRGQQLVRSRSGQFRGENKEGGGEGEARRGWRDKLRASQFYEKRKTPVKISRVRINGSLCTLLSRHYGNSLMPSAEPEQPAIPPREISPSLLATQIRDDLRPTKGLIISPDILKLLIYMESWEDVGPEHGPPHFRFNADQT